jgi:RNA methyltransferase, TrmH family
MIESLNSPHIARVKALISSRGVKERKQSSQFVAEGLQCAKEALSIFDNKNGFQGPSIEMLFLTPNGRSKLEQVKDIDLNRALNIIDVNDDVMKQMSETITPQGVLAICSMGTSDLGSFKLNGKRRFIYLSEIQDPGNAGTIIRSSDAFGMDAVITSPGSVDMFSPKVVRSTAGSLWHIPVFESVDLSEILKLGVQAISLGAEGDKSLSDFEPSGDVVAIFGNEARGLSSLKSMNGVEIVNIPMPGDAESLNLSAAATIVMYHFSLLPAK